MESRIELNAVIFVNGGNVSIEVHRDSNEYVVYITGVNRYATFHAHSLEDFKEFLNDIIKAVEVAEL